MRNEQPSSDRRMEVLFDEHFEAIRAYCMRRLPVGDANDAVADVFMTAWRKVDDLPQEPETLAYLYGIARNTVAHSRRSFSRRSRLREKVAAAPIVRPDGPEAIVITRAEHDELTTAYEQLRETDREVLRLRAWEELTAPQIAQVLGVSVAAAEKRIARALDRLGTSVRRSRQPTRPHASQEGGER